MFSRAKANRYTSSGKSASIGAQALIRFMQAYGTCAETILGGMSCSKSEGVHLLA